MPDICPPSLQEESLPAESTLTTETQERTRRPGLLTEANRIKKNKLQPETTITTNSRDYQMAKVNERILLKETKTTHHHQNPALPPQPVLDTSTHSKS